MTAVKASGGVFISVTHGSIQQREALATFLSGDDRASVPSLRNGSAAALDLLVYLGTAEGFTTTSIID